MEKIMENSSDLHVVARKVYAKPSDAYAIPIQTTRQRSQQTSCMTHLLRG